MEAAVISAGCDISVLDPHLLSTIFSFCDLRTSTCVLRPVCKAWRNACNSPLAFADQRLVLTHPAAAASWVHCFTLIKRLDLQCRDQIQFDEMIDALAPRNLCVSRLKVSIHNYVRQMQISRSLSRLSAAFRNLTHITLKVHMMHTAPGDDRDFVVDDTELLLSFSQHFPHITSLHFSNRGNFIALHDNPPEHLALVRCVSSLPSLTSLRCFSTTLTLSNDNLLHTISQACPQLQEFRVVPIMRHRMTPDGLQTLFASCPHITSVALSGWLEPLSAAVAVGKLLASNHNIRTLDFRFSYDNVEDVSAVLASCPHVTRIITNLGWAYWSPHVQDVTIYSVDAPNVHVIHTYLTRLPHVRSVVVRVAINEGSISGEDFLYLRSKYPTVERLVWQRDWLTASDPCKSEEVYRAETGDPKTYRVIF